MTMLVGYPIMGLSYARGYFAICGGGGSLKSGIKNTVDIYKLSEAESTGFEKVITAETGSELPSGVAFSHDGQLIAVSVNCACWIFELNLQENKMQLLVKFRTDFAEEESSQTCACFVGNSTVLTGGEDGVVRVWKLSREFSANEKSAGTDASLQVPDPSSKKSTKKPSAPQLGDSAIHKQNMITLTREYRGHSKRIREIHVDPSHRNLVVSSSLDQSCHLWRLTELSTLCEFSKDDALEESYRMLNMKLPPGPRKHQFRCVRFANDGRKLYTVLTPARGDSIVVKWVPETIAQTEEGQWKWVIEFAAVAGNRPVGSLCVSPDDKFLCTAAVSGEISVFKAETLEGYRQRSKDQHSFAITGMSFAPIEDKQSKVCHLVTGGADKFVLRHEVPLEGGEVISRWMALKTVLSELIASLMTMGLGAIAGFTLLFALLMFLHADQNILNDGPLTALDELMELNVESMDAMATVGAVGVSTLMACLVAFALSVRTAVFTNGLVCLVAAILAFVVAMSPSRQLGWVTGNAALDDLLDYKMSVVFSACSIVFLFLHSLLTLCQ